MDPVTLAYYAAVCGVLSVGAPRLGRFPVRFLVGAVVGIVAAGVLPVVTNLMSGY